MTSRALLPLRPRPEPDELFSSWALRLAWANGMAYVPFLRQLYPQGRHFQRDLDWTAATGLLEAVSRSAGLDLEQVHRATLQTYRGRLFADEIRLFPGRWLLYTQASNRLEIGQGHRDRVVPSHGLQYCPDCLAQAPIYYRLGWRLAFNTTCKQHGRLLLDCCPACEQPVALPRSSPAICGMDVAVEAMAHCAFCGFDFRDLSFEPYDTTEVLTESGAYRTEKYWGWVQSEMMKRVHGAARFQVKIDLALATGFYPLTPEQAVPVREFMAGLAHLAHMLTSIPGLEAWRRVVGLGSEASLYLVPEANLRFGSRRVEVRHAVMRALYWLLSDWPTRFHHCCEAAKLSRSLLFDSNVPVAWLSREADRYDGFIRRPHLKTVQPWNRSKFPFRTTSPE